MNALARRKDYGTKRNLKKMLAFSNANRQVDGIKKKSEKIKPNDTKNSSVQPPLPVNITIEKVSKRASTINNIGNASGEISKELSIDLAPDSFKYDDDFDPIDEDKIAQQESSGDGLQNLVDINSSETRYSRVQQESINNNANVSVTGN